ncbi:protein AGENET DOMAIN (AGD)-CONTAINING P1-like [Salvia hispanica]|uniref:protein AGENET DOMAIN (AGD)-CONTAINING P1-like n=1 Tax=Salvia hispanica TaxID=49212 RepID=UPI0020091C53|nr:protein AGENET DOMAIN (AGD)-CONTAINING P1-like [Salvia hispanica]
MAGGGESSILRYFKKGAEVEVNSDDDGFRGSWFLATVIRAPKDESSKVLVEYKTLTEDEAGKRPLREPLSLVVLRPPPPKENRTSFEFSDEVDAYYNDGWWEGVITRKFEGKDKYTVFFRGSREELSFTASQLRLHREWVTGGNWVPPLLPYPHANKTPLSAEAEDSTVATEHNFNPGNHAEASNDEDGFENGSIQYHKKTPSSAEAKGSMVATKHNFNSGDHAEASSDEDGFEGAWFPVIVLEKRAAGKYLIEYKKLMNDDGTDFLREEINELHLRPSPPDVGVIDRFKVNDQVDAFYNDCWWVGRVTKILVKERYSVYFENPPEELKFEHSDLRVHQEWRNGKWHCF